MTTPAGDAQAMAAWAKKKCNKAIFLAYILTIPVSDRPKFFAAMEATQVINAARRAAK